MKQNQLTINLGTKPKQAKEAKNTFSLNSRKRSMQFRPKIVIGATSARAGSPNNRDLGEVANPYERDSQKEKSQDMKASSIY